MRTPPFLVTIHHHFPEVVLMLRADDEIKYGIASSIPNDSNNVTIGVRS